VRLSRLLCAASLAVLAAVPVVAGSASAASTSTPDGTTVIGTVQVLAVDAAGGHDRHGEVHEDELVTRTVVAVGDRLVPVPARHAAGLTSGDTVGLALGAAPAGAPGTSAPVLSVTELPRRAARADGGVLGRHTLTVLPVHWGRPDTATTASLGALARETAGYWSEQSAGRIRIAPSVRGWARIADPGSCDPDALYTSALAAHRVAAPTSRLQHVLVYFPRRADCSWAGLGSIRGSLMWSNGWQLADVVAHEFGHNLGLGHAGTATCTGPRGRVPLSAGCTISEYADGADVMGSATRMRSGNLNAALADHLGLARAVTASTTERTVVDVAPLARTDAVRAVRVAVPAGTVVISLRPATGRDVRRPAWAGVQVHLRTTASTPRTRLLDMQPWNATAFGSPALPANAVWVVPGGGVSVRVTRLSTASARVEVVPVAGDRTAPTPPVLSPGTRTGTLSGGGVVGWSAARDTGTGVAAYRVLLDGAPLAHLPPTARSMRLPALAAGRHVLRVVAVDAAGNTSAAGPGAYVHGSP
jgi:hypothetical protein